MKTIIAIDPGASGAIATYSDLSGGAQVEVCAMPDTIRDLWDEFGCYQQFPKRFEAVIEDVGYHVQGNNASASCKFARHVGHVEMALVAAGIPFTSVRPQKWMKHYGTLPKDKAERKRKIKDLMQRLYPQIKVTLQNADALAILTWALAQKGRE